MARTLKEFRVKINGNSLQVWKLGIYGGSISLNELFHLVVSKRRNGTNPFLAQQKFINDDS